MHNGGGADAKPSRDDFTFVQISDSHIGFNRPANPDVTGTMKVAIDKINEIEAAFKQRFPQTQWTFFEPDVR